MNERLNQILSPLRDYTRCKSLFHPKGDDFYNTKGKQKTPEVEITTLRSTGTRESFNRSGRKPSLSEYTCRFLGSSTWLIRICLSNCGSSLALTLPPMIYSDTCQLRSFITMPPSPNTLPILQSYHYRRPSPPALSQKVSEIQAPYSPPPPMNLGSVPCSSECVPRPTARGRRGLAAPSSVR
jgi:hypothetical protein